MKGQNTTGIGMKNFSPIYRALGDYEVRKVYVEKESLDERGLKSEDLMELAYEDEEEGFAKKPLIRIVSRAELTEIMGQQDVLLNF